MFEGAWQGLHIATPKESFVAVDTAVPEAEILEIGNKITTLPEGKAFFKKIEKLFEERNKMVNQTGFLTGLWVNYWPMAAC